VNIRQHSMRRPNGVIIETLPSGREIHTDTVRCVHCQAHRKWVCGSGNLRSWCDPCGGWTCGTKKCSICVHWEQVLDNVEAGRPRYYKPIPKVSLRNTFAAVVSKGLWIPFVRKS